MSDDGRRRELAEFLRSRRERLLPEDVGLPTAGRRRTPGLRREEIAVAAGVSLSWYTFLEQARPIRVSAQVLDSVATTLRLTEAERAHVFLLAHGQTPPIREEPAVVLVADIRRILQLLPVPAYVLGPDWALLGSNAPARALFDDWSGYRGDDRNVLWWMFTAPQARLLFPEWETEAAALLARFRAGGAGYRGPRYGALVARLSTSSPQFNEWWQRHEVQTRQSGSKLFCHPSAGTFRLEHAVLQLPESPEQKVVVYTAEPDSADERALQVVLGS